LGDEVYVIDGIDDKRLQIPGIGDVQSHLEMRIFQDLPKKEGMSKASQSS
jgi:hypothetical protein